MKFLVFAIAMFVSAQVWAGPKQDICSQYENTALEKGANNVPLIMIAQIFNVAWELNFTPDQMAKLLAVLTDAAARNPQGIENMGKAAYAACSIDFTPEDIASVRAMYLKVIGE